VPRRNARLPGQSTWAPRLAVLSTVALILCLVVPDRLRSLFAFAWVCLALAAMGLEWTARRRAPRAR
jgi:hypothetical protein